MTQRQQAALPYLVSSSTLSEGARLANIGRTTLHRWMQDYEFRTELERLRSEAAELAVTELRGLMLKATLILAEAMETSSPNIRLKASRIALAVGLRDREFGELSRRIDRVDDALRLLAKRRPFR